MYFVRTVNALTPANPEYQGAQGLQREALLRKAINRAVQSEPSRPGLDHHRGN